MGEHQPGRTPPPTKINLFSDIRTRTARALGDEIVNETSNVFVINANLRELSQL